MLKRSNQDVGGRMIEVAGHEHFIRGRGYIKSPAQIEGIVLGTGRGGVPIRVRDVAQVTLGPAMSRGLAELDGEGQTVGGVVVMRYGQNALEVIERVKSRIEEVRSALPEGVEIVTAYDRSDLITRAIDTLRHTLIEEMIVVSLVIIVFLLHFRSSLVAILTLPLAILLAFIPLSGQALTANIMSLGGIAVAIGALVDASIVIIENIHKHLERWEAEGRNGSRREVIIRAMQEVGPSIFFALLIITVSFLPVFALEGTEGRLFKPLAFTKTYSMAFAAVGGVAVSETVEGRERYAILLRYAREFREDPESLERVPVPTPSGAQVPLSQLATLHFRTGPDMLRTEEAQLVAIVFIDVKDIGIPDYVNLAREVVKEKVTIPAGYRLTWAGQFQYFERAKARLKILVPLTLFIVFFMLFTNSGSVRKSLIILLTIPFSLIGAVWLLYWLDYNLSVAVWVGMIALAGLAAELGVLMMLYLKLAYQERAGRGEMRTPADLAEAIVEGAARRLRPKLMTGMALLLGLVPILWSSGTGADVMKRIAAPMVGGIFSAIVLTLIVLPAVYAIWRWPKDDRRGFRVSKTVPHR